ncbi:MAG: glycosyltransferase [Planctomycetota bacterium]|nr:glycosyltransferase [Planctomycetota bacterium]
MAAKPRIMMISIHGYVAAEPELGKPDTGGQVLYVLELSRSLARLGYQVDILTRRFENQPRSEHVDTGVTLWRIPCGGGEFIAKEHMHESVPEWVENVRQFIRSKRRRYAFINSHYWDAGIAGQMLARELAIPHLHTPHSIGAWKRDNMDGDPEELDRLYNFRTRVREEKVIYDGCDLVITTTPQQRDLVAASDYDTPREKIHVIPAGYDDTRFYPVARASRTALKQNLGYDGRIVLALGRMATNKGYDLLIRSMKPVVERVDDARLLLAIGSTEPSQEEIKQIGELKDIVAELGMTDRVIFRDYITDEELPDHYRLADVFALSSRYEPFGMTAVEAMACGTPTVITTEGGLWEQVVWGVEALYANPFDTEAFGHAICSILQHQRVYDNLAKYGSQKVRARFTWTGIAQQILRLADEMPKGPSVAKRGAKRTPGKAAVPADESESDEAIPEIEVGAGLAETLPSA